MSILLAHEMGHYLVCRLYGVDATLPFFIPLSRMPVSFVGTLGAFIRIASPIPDRRALFDIGVAGPLAGLRGLPARARPRRAGGAARARERDPEAACARRAAALPVGRRRLLRRPRPDGMDARASARSAWPPGSACFVTALNLMPIGQLDGGHVAYALLRRRYALRLARRPGRVPGPALLPPDLARCGRCSCSSLGRRHPPTLDDARAARPRPRGGGRPRASRCSRSASRRAPF